jgi:PAS domain S-box-containing protein
LENEAMSLNNVIRGDFQGSACPAGGEPAAAFMPAPEPSAERILDSITDVVDVIDAQGVITYSNMPFSHQGMLGLDKVLGGGCRRVHGKACISCANHPLEEVLKSGRSMNLECPIVLRDGKTGWVRQHLYPIPDSTGGVSSVLRIVFDITREKQEQAKDAKYMDSLEQSLFNRSQDQPPALPQDLSAREREVLSYMVDGMSNQEIARLLGISHHTVKTHVVHIFNKLGVKDRTQAAVTATRMELV